MINLEFSYKGEQRSKAGTETVCRVIKKKVFEGGNTTACLCDKGNDYVEQRDVTAEGKHEKLMSKVFDYTKGSGSQCKSGKCPFLAEEEHFHHGGGRIVWDDALHWQVCGGKMSSLSMTSVFNEV